MLKTIFSKVMWVGRATVFTVGLAVTLALMLGVATAALAAVPGDPFKLGRSNAINRLTALVGGVDSALLRVDNNSASFPRRDAGPAIERLPVQLLVDGVHRLAAQGQVGGQLAANGGDELPDLRHLGTGVRHLAARGRFSPSVVEDDVAAGNAVGLTTE